MKDFIEQIRAAIDANSPLCIQGNGSKRFYGNTCSASPLTTSGHQGIISYQPEELVVTARAGTSIREIQATLAEKGQVLAFEPPDFAPGGTLGGMIAAGFSGPARPWRGSLRDALLGISLINGKGESLKLGGEVIKNVAGYDASRLMAGAFGSLGLIVEASVRTIPAPEMTVTRAISMDAASGLLEMQRIGRSPLPVSGAAWHQGTTYLRFSGNSAGVQAAIAQIGGKTIENNEFWDTLNNHQLTFFRDQPVWRLSLPPATAHLDLPGDQLIDWGGAQRWLIADEHDASIPAIASNNGGHAVIFRGGEPRPQTLPDSLARLHQNLKNAFDPQRIFNPERVYQDL